MSRDQMLFKNLIYKLKVKDKKKNVIMVLETKNIEFLLSLTKKYLKYAYDYISII